MNNALQLRSFSSVRNLNRCTKHYLNEDRFLNWFFHVLKTLQEFTITTVQFTRSLGVNYNSEQLKRETHSDPLCGWWHHHFQHLCPWLTLTWWKRNALESNQLRSLTEVLILWLINHLQFISVYLLKQVSTMKSGRTSNHTWQPVMSKGVMTDLFSLLKAGKRARNISSTDSRMDWSRLWWSRSKHTNWLQRKRGRCFSRGDIRRKAWIMNLALLPPPTTLH